MDKRKELFSSSKQDLVKLAKYQSPAENVEVLIKPGYVKALTKSNGMAKVTLNTQGGDKTLQITGLFGDAVSAVIDWHQEVNPQSVAFKEFIPRHSKKPVPSSSFTCPPADRAEKKASMAARTPLSKSREAHQMVLTDKLMEDITSPWRQQHMLCWLW
ncbi:hypothetical protein KOW79_020971 [Hemibagrus wyckioides]|uniref:Uncharacterized protein n=1 Tax=Hemibagrus wyckioides TaxID=337641 RepID=A0A9D3N5P6_9TELE|nr:hypothetical protein KOW79_020971 [Hemibagrus wyckioides]